MDYKDYSRDYLREAKDIIAGKSSLLCEREHLIALNQVIREMIPLLDNLGIMANSLRGNIRGLEDKYGGGK